MSKVNKDIKRVKNLGFNTTNVAQSTNLGKNRNNPDAVKRDLRNFISPVQLTRLRTDVSMWRDAIAETERAYYPFRVKMQRIYIDTILNGHVYSLMERRKDLTLLRNFKVCNAAGVESKELTAALKAEAWFRDLVEYCLDAIFFGYSLISLGDIEADVMNECSLVPRWFVSPDRKEVATYIYGTSGAPFTENPYNDWHIYAKTKSDNGVSPCGYGLFYSIALYEIFLRNTLGYNGDYVELYAMPYRVGKTTKTTESERAELEAAVRNMGSAGYAILDPMDEIEFLTANSAGTGYQAYDNLEVRCQKIVSKIILGHADAMDSIPGKLGSQQGDQNPIVAAMNDKQIKDGKFIENIINQQLFPKLKNIGYEALIIPEGYRFEFLNDGELNEQREKEDKNNLTTAQIAQTMKNSGLQMDAEYFAKRTGIPTEKIEAPEPVPTGGKEKDDDDIATTEKVKNKLKNFYAQ